MIDAGKLEQQYCNIILLICGKSIWFLDMIFIHYESMAEHDTQKLHF